MRHQIEQFRIARKFDHHCAERRRGQRIGRRTQDAGGIRDAQQQDARRVEPEFQKARGRQLAMFQRGKILTNPQKVFAAAEARSERGGKSRGRSLMRGLGKDLVQRTAVQTDVRQGVTERHARLSLWRLQSRFGERGAQNRNFLRRVAHVSRAFPQRERRSSASYQVRTNKEHKSTRVCYERKFISRCGGGFSAKAAPPCLNSAFRRFALRRTL